jgi:succinyl-diaminopimelate desuccinylase
MTSQLSAANAASGELYEALDAWVDAHFDDEVAFLAELVKVPTDTPPGNNAPHAERAAQLLQAFGFAVEKHAVPQEEVKAYGLQSITNLIVRRRYGQGPCVALNAHGDVVPPGEGWTVPPYGAEVRDGRLYGRAAAVSKSDFATYAFAVRALEAVAGIEPGTGTAGGGGANDGHLRGSVELHFTYDEEYGGEKGPGWLLSHGLTQPDYAIAASFSYAVITAHNGCLQFEVTVNGRMAHAAIPESGVDALQAAVRILDALYACNQRYQNVTSSVAGISHPHLNVGMINGGTNTNVVPGKVIFRIDRRCIPEEDPVAVEAEVREVIVAAARGLPDISVAVRRILLAHPL